MREWQGTFSAARPLSAAVTLLASHHILANAGWRYPLHLLTLQLTVFLVAVLFGTNWSRHEAYRASPKTAFLGGMPYVICLPLFAQALSHFLNTPALPLLFCLALAPSLLADVNIANYSSTLGWPLRRFLLCLLALSGIIYLDYRLTVDGIILAVSSIGLFGLFKSYVSASSGQSTLAIPSLDHLPVIVSTTILTAIGALIIEDTTASLRLLGKFRLLDVAVFLLSVLSFTATFLHSSVSATKSLPISWTGLQQPLVIWFAFCVSALVTISTTWCNLGLVNIPQIMLHFIAGATLLDVDFARLSSDTVLGLSQPGRLLGLLMTLTPLHIRHVQYHSPYPEADVLSLDDGYDDSDEESPSRLLSQATLLDQAHNSFSFNAERYAQGLTVASLLLWGVAVAMSITASQPTTFPNRKLYLDATFTPPTDLDIVISMFDEPLSVLAATLGLLASIPTIVSHAPRVYIYTKDYKADLSAISKAVPQSFQHVKVSIRANVGRESETYLGHILTHWDNMAKHTLFLQAETHNPRDLRPRIMNYFGSDTGMLPLGFSQGATCACGSDVCSDLYGWTDDATLLHETFLSSARLASCPTAQTPIMLSYKGQFIASAARIRGVDRSNYEKLRWLLADPETWPHKSEYLKGRVEDMTTPIIGYTIERSWAALLQCADEEVIKYCPSLLSGWRHGGSRRDCQCLDIQEDKDEI